MSPPCSQTSWRRLHNAGAVRIPPPECRCWTLGLIMTMTGNNALYCSNKNTRLDLDPELSGRSYTGHQYISGVWKLCLLTEQLDRKPQLVQAGIGDINANFHDYFISGVYSLKITNGRGVVDQCATTVRHFPVEHLLHLFTLLPELLIPVDT